MSQADVLPGVKIDYAAFQVERVEAGSNAHRYHRDGAVYQLKGRMAILTHLVKAVTYA